MNIQNKSVTPNPCDAFPPLPDPLTSSPIASRPEQAASGASGLAGQIVAPQLPPQWGPGPGEHWPVIRDLRSGAYLLNYQPGGSPFVTYDGTLRVERHSGGRTASGDLYQRTLWIPPIPGLPKPGLPKTGLPKQGVPAMPMKPILLAGPDPAKGIPVLPIGQYRYYLRVTELSQSYFFGNSVVFSFQMWRYMGGTWTNQATLTATMTWQAAPAGYPSTGDYLAGDVTNSSGTVVGRLTMGWVSESLRKATVEIDRVPQSETPRDDGAGTGWKKIWAAVGWDITTVESESNLVEPSGESWSDGECHNAMLAHRDANDLDVEWRYHVLCVRRLDSTERGLMYDAYGGDSNKIPREGCAIASHWMIPGTPQWGLVQNIRLGAATGPYFRTAVHETGHAMGLYHNTLDNGYMNTTDVIALDSLSAGNLPFPLNIQWSFNPADAKRLRHMPDIYVRPGGMPFGTPYAATPISPDDLEVVIPTVQLHVAPVLGSVPLGAPVRLNLELVNTGDEPVMAPTTLSMKRGFVKGTVIDPSGVAKDFSPLVLCLDDHPVAPLEPDARIRDSITLLRGAPGALFSAPGAYRVVVEVRWDHGGVTGAVQGETSVMVTSAADEAHAHAALKLLATPDTLLVLVLGGDHLVEGIGAIQGALTNPVLRPHYAYIEAKRMAERFGKRKADLASAARLIDDQTVMSPAEIKKAARLVKSAGADTAPGKEIAKNLRSNPELLDAGDDVKRLVESL